MIEAIFVLYSVDYQWLVVARLCFYFFRQVTRKAYISMCKTNVKTINKFNIRVEKWMLLFIINSSLKRPLLANYNPHEQSKKQRIAPILDSSPTMCRVLLLGRYGSVRTMSDGLSKRGVYFPRFERTSDYHRRYCAEHFDHELQPIYGYYWRQ